MPALTAQEETSKSMRSRNDFVFYCFASMELLYYYPDLQVLFTCKLSSTSAIMVHNRLACAVLIYGSLAFWDPEKLVCRPLNPPLTATSVLAWKRQQPFGLAAEKFIQYAKEALRTGPHGNTAKE